MSIHENHKKWLSKSGEDNLLYLRNKIAGTNGKLEKSNAIQQSYKKIIRRRVSAHWYSL